VNDEPELTWWGWMMPWWGWLLMLVAALAGAGFALLWFMWYMSKVFRR
jgi:UDP-N-acetylmuramyl pentapeptide phosphotransferase/UDP-N-acetylglucosamine-1-phosphate transferase